MQTPLFTGLNCIAELCWKRVHSIESLHFTFETTIPISSCLLATSQQARRHMLPARPRSRNDDLHRHMPALFHSDSSRSTVGSMAEELPASQPGGYDNFLQRAVNFSRFENSRNTTSSPDIARGEGSTAKQTADRGSGDNTSSSFETMGTLSPPHDSLASMSAARSRATKSECNSPLHGATPRRLQASEGKGPATGDTIEDLVGTTPCNTPRVGGGGVRKRRCTVAAGVRPTRAALEPDSAARGGVSCIGRCVSMAGDSRVRTWAVPGG